MEPGKRLLDKVAIVSGGASGIGAETARQFGRHGARVVVSDLNSNLGHAVVEEINASGATAIFKNLDVIDEAQWAELMAETEAEFGKVDVLANVAGISGRDPTQEFDPKGMMLEDMTLETWNKVMDVNSTGVYLGTKHAIAPMRRAGGGAVINISSICGIVGSFGSPAYNASKGAVRIFSKAAAIQYAPEGIRVNSIHPGFVDTPLTEQIHAHPEGAKSRHDATPLGRLGQPVDIAMGCVYLASDEAAWVTGSELVIDGGMTAN